MSTLHHLHLDAAPRTPAEEPGGGAEALGRDLLLANARWFVRIRWAVIGGLAAGGGAGWWAVLEQGRTGWLPLLGWSFSLTCLLTVANLLFDRRLRALGGIRPLPPIEGLIWLQIVTDLSVLTVLMHQAGLTETFMAFAYLFHIVLACIFFPTRKSLLVTALALLLYLGCWLLEQGGLLAHHGLPGLRAPSPAGPADGLAPLSVLFVWCVVWYLASTLSRSVRRRDRELARANERLLAADREKNLLMLRTVHDLKAPFAGIETNIEMLKRQDWGQLPDSARTLITAIENRSATLRERIRDILLLGELRRMEERTVPDEKIELEELLAAVLEEVAGKAEQRRVSIAFHPLQAAVRSNRRQLHTAFANLVTNAIVYSHEGGAVRIDMHAVPGGVKVGIADQGIGISADALARIFEEYYRTEEAARFNPLSTGLGLAIVRQIASNLRLELNVASESGTGTTVEVLVPQDRRGDPWRRS